HAADRTGSPRSQCDQRLVGTDEDMAAELRATHHRAAKLLARGAAALQRDAACAQLAIDRDLDRAAEHVAAGRAAQHLAEIDAVRIALEVDREGRLAGVDRAREIDRPTVETALQMLEREQPVLQREGDV